MAGLEKERTTLSQLYNLSRQYTDSYEEQELLEEHINQITSQGLMTDQEKEQIAELYIQGLYEEKSQEEVITEIINLQNQAIERQRALVGQINQGLEGREAMEGGELQRLIEQQRARKALIDQTTKEAEARKVMQDGVRGLATAASLITTSIGLIKTLTDETATAGEKVERVITTLAFSLPMLITNFSSLKSIIPMLRQGVISLASGLGLVSATGTTALGAVGALAKAGGPYGAAIAAVVAVIYLAVKAHKADADAAKKAAEEAANLKKANDSLQQSYKNLKSSIEDYTDSVNALKELTENTEDYADAVEKANEKALELAESNLVLQAAMYRGSDGVLRFKEGVLEAIEAESKLHAANASQAAMFGQINANRARAKSDVTDLGRDGVGEFVRNSERSAAWVGVSQNIIEQLRQIYEENGTLITSDVNKLSGVSDVLKRSLIDNWKKVVELVESNQELAEENRTLATHITETYMGQHNETYQGMTPAEQAALSRMIGGDILNDDQYQTAYDARLNELNDIWDRYNDNDLHKEYAKLMGYTATKNKVGKGVYVDQEGNEIPIDDDTARQVIANQAGMAAAADESADSFKDAQEVVDKLTEAGEGLNEALGTDNMVEELLGFVGKVDTSFENLNSLSPEDIEKLREAIAGSALQDIDEEDAERMGYSSEEAFIRGINRALDEYDPMVWWNNQYAAAAGNASAVSGIISSTQNNEGLGEDEQATLDALIQKYDKIDDIRTASGHEYLQILRNIQELEEKSSRDALDHLQEEQKARAEELSERVEENKKLLKKFDNLPIPNFIKEQYQLKIAADTEELDNTLQQIQDTDYQIEVAIKADLATDVEQAFGLADDFGELQDMLSETLEITFDEAQEIIANGYGAILENARETADQTIIIDRAVADAFIENKQIELNADKESKIEQLENERTLLESRRNILQAKIEALTAASEAETAEGAATALAAAKLLDQELANNQAALNQKLSDEEDANEEISADQTSLADFLSEVDANIADNAGLAASSAKQSSEALAAASINDANQVSEAWKQAWISMEGGEGNVTSYSPSGADTGSTYSGSALSSTYERTNYTLEGLTQSILDATKTSTEAIKAEAQRQRDLAQQELDSVNAQIGAVDAGIAALKSADSSLDEARKTAGTKKGDSGGGSKEKDPDQMDYLDDEIDKYHDINNELKQIASTLKIIQGQEDKYIRAGLTHNLEKQLEILKKQEEAQRRKLELAKADLQAQAALLQAKGVQIGKDGQILNYAGILAAKQAEINSLIAEYNGLSAADQEGYKSAIEQKKQEYEQLKSQMSAYDTLLNDTIPQLISDIQDTVDAEIDAQIKKFNVMIEAHLDIKSLEEEWNKFKAKVILDLDDDDYLGKAQNAMERFANYYQSDGSGIVQDLTKHVQEVTDQVRSIEQTGASSIYGDNEAQAMEDLRNYTEELMNSLEEIEDLEEEVYDDYLDLIDKAQDAFDKQVETYEQITDIIEHDIELTKLLWGDDAYDTLDAYYSKQETNNNQQLDFLRRQADMWKQLMDNEEEGTEAWEKYRENWMSSVSDLSSLVEESVQNLLDKYSNTMSKIINDLSNKITGGKGLDYVSEEWDLINKAADQYLDTINAGYAIQKLENEINQSLNDLQGNVAAQQALNKLRDEELQKLKDKEKITQYDVDRAELMYQIALKQIALEEAQQNKSSVRLRRDSQGNYTYQYVADDNQIAEAQQALNETQNNLFNLDRDTYRENLDSIYEIYNEFQEKVLELYQDMTLSDEEREAKKQLYAEYYGQLINNLVTENEYIKLNLMDSTFQSLADLYNQDVENFYNMSQAEQDELINSIVPQWNTSIQEMANTFAGEGGFIPTCQEAFMSLEETTDQYRQSLDALAAAAGIDFGYISSGIDWTIGETQALLQGNEQLIQSYMNEINAIQSVVANLQNLISSYHGAQQAAIAAADAARQLYEAANGAAAAANNMMSAFAGGGSSGGGGIGGGSSGSGLSGADVEGIAGNIWVYGDWGNNPTRNATMIEKFGAEDGQRIYQAVQDKFNSGYGYNGGLKYDWEYYKKFAPSAFATGGYTGEWASGGKLGILHEKELVLNAEDTANILDAVAVVRGIAQRAMNLGVTMGDLAANTGSVGYSEALEQSVHIDAQFPNVTNSEEIQNAFNNLVNQATQYANANRRKK